MVGSRGDGGLGVGAQGVVGVEGGWVVSKG